MTARRQSIRSFLPAMNLYKLGSRIDSQDYTGNFHPGMNPRRPRSCANRVRVGGGLASKGSFSPAGLKRYRSDSGTSVDRVGGAETRRVSSSDTTMNATQRPTTAEQTTNTMERGGKLR